jgi:hypothetical protein
MGGGLLQLIAVGQIDEFLSINPQLSFYQYVYKRHSNFAMESKQLNFSKNPEISTDQIANTVECIIPRYGDLLSQLYFSLTLPDIYSSDKYRFRWVSRVGNVIIKKASVHIDGLMIDQTTGEWMSIWNELILPEGDTKNDQIIGNVPELQNPTTATPKITIVNNRFIYYHYPASSKDGNQPPSIKAREITIPLNFWFTKNPALALPLLRLSTNIVTVRIELESSENLYQVYSKDLELYTSPAYFNELYGDNIDMKTFTKEYSLNPYIDANYIFLGEEERNTLFRKSKLSYLVEQLTINSAQSVSSKNQSLFNVNITVNTPTKEIIWTTKRDDFYKYNEHINFSPDFPESSQSILNNARLYFNNNDRTQTKPSQYFNVTQPYQHHSRIPKQGIYCYSFALYPQKEFLSGYYNSALVKTNLLIGVNTHYDNGKINDVLTTMNKPTYEFDYLVTAYCLTYNLFEIVGNQVGMMFNL